tara:strand:- start:117 stop:269 length:153 start_codon:yes stop_codon:yes gene_type:complete
MIEISNICEIDNFENYYNSEKIKQKKNPDFSRKDIMNITICNWYKKNNLF